MNPSVKKTISFVIKAVLTLVVVYFVAVQLIDNWQAVREFQWHLNFFLLIASILLHLITFLLFSWVWCKLMLGFGYQVPLRHGFKVAYIANLGRYVPGRIWPVFGMTYVAKQINVPKETAVASWVIALLFGIPPSFLVALLGMLLVPEMLAGSWGSALRPQLPLLFAVTIALSLCLLILPKYIVVLLNFVLKKLKRSEIHFSMSVRLASVVYFGYFVCWIIYGLAFWTFLYALSPNHVISTVAAVGAFVTAYQAGYFMIFTPGGIGTRELVLAGLLAPFIGPASVGIAVAARIWNTLCDIIASVIAIKIKV